MPESKRAPFNPLGDILTKELQRMWDEADNTGDVYKGIAKGQIWEELNRRQQQLTGSTIGETKTPEPQKSIRLRGLKTTRPHPIDSSWGMAGISKRGADIARSKR